MAWNEPGGNSGGKRNPWGGGNKPEQGPPDLDEVVRNLQRRLAALFGGGGGGTRHRRRRGPGRGFGIGTIVLVLVAIWAFTGLYQVDAAERGIVLRFGKHVATDACPACAGTCRGRSRRKQIVNIQTIESFTEQTRMLTSDENLVDINLEVQFRRANPLDYAFNVVKPGGHAARK